MSVDHPTLLAALDLGSNSFHLLISEVRDGQLYEVRRHKDLVQLARAVNDKGQLDNAAVERALEALRHCKALLDQYPMTYLRIVGTQILRQCQDPAKLMQAAQAIMQTPIEIISGDEEASLVYLGGSNSLTAQQRSRNLLVLDVGGASTEIITANDTIVDKKLSLPLGCVTLANQYFHSSKSIETVSLNAAYAHANESFTAANAKLGDNTTELAIGASGTLRVLLDLLSNKSATNPTNCIHKSQLDELLQSMIANGAMDDCVPENLRWDVLPAGIAILAAFLQVFKLETIEVSANSIKEGMMLEWLNQRPTTVD